MVDDWILRFNPCKLIANIYKRKPFKEKSSHVF